MQIVRRAKNGMGGFLSATFEAVHPAELGLEIPWLPCDAYANRQTQLRVRRQL